MSSWWPDPAAGSTAKNWGAEKARRAGKRAQRALKGQAAHADTQRNRAAAAPRSRTRPSNALRQSASCQLSPTPGAPFSACDGRGRRARQRRKWGRSQLLRSACERDADPPPRGGSHQHVHTRLRLRAHIRHQRLHSCSHGGHARRRSGLLGAVLAASAHAAPLADRNSGTRSTTGGGGRCGFARHTRSRLLSSLPARRARAFWTSRQLHAHREKL